ncbi:hypothetical protein OROGR_021569 [Orobanche gracilis]
MSGADLLHQDSFFAPRSSYPQFDKAGVADNSMREIYAFLPMLPTRLDIALDTVARNNVVSFKVALRFWMTSVRPIMNQGFGATIRDINSGECNNVNSGVAEARVGYYSDYCNKFGAS